MRAFAIPDFDGIGSVVDRPLPQPGTGEILVRVRAAGVNPMDSVVAHGWMAQTVEHRKPLVPGFDYAGAVEAVGPGVENVGLSDEVYGAVGKPVFGEGSWAEYATVSGALANPLDEGLDPLDAAALATAGGEALALVDAVDPKKGDVILIVGAAGGVGSFAVQLATRAGARVVAATRTRNAAYMRELGGTDVIDTGGDVVAQVRERYPDGVDALIDTYNDVEGLKALAQCVRKGGWIVSPTAQGVEDAFLDSPVQAALVSAALGRVGELGARVGRGEIKVFRESVSLDEAGRALEAISNAGVRGKLVIAID